MALNSGFNIVPQDMLSIRRDTPRRLRKYNQRGFGAILPGVMLPSSERILERCQELYDPTKYLDMERIFWQEVYDTEDAVAHILKDNRVYTETNLPRGLGITPAIVLDLYLALRAKGLAAGRTCAVNVYEKPNLIFKHMKSVERWAQFGMV